MDLHKNCLRHCVEELPPESWITIHLVCSLEKCIQVCSFLNVDSTIRFLECPEEDSWPNISSPRFSREFPYLCCLQHKCLRTNMISLYLCACFVILQHKKAIHFLNTLQSPRYFEESIFCGTCNKTYILKTGVICHYYPILSYDTSCSRSTSQLYTFIQLILTSQSEKHSNSLQFAF